MKKLQKEAEIKELDHPDGGLRLGLFIEGERRATASAGFDELAAMRQHLDKDREAVKDDLSEALDAWFGGELDKVVISDLNQQDELYYVAEYTYRAFDKIRAGHVWYDVEAGETGPDETPAVVRNQMRAQLHQTMRDEHLDASR